MRRILVLLFLIPVLSALSASPLKVACVGDSITYGLRIQDRDEHAYPAVLQTLLGDAYEVRNYGVSSSAAQDDSNRPYRKKKAYRESLAWEPDVVVLMLGTNDSKTQNWHGMDRFLAAMRLIIEDYRKLPSRPDIYLLSPPKAWSHYLGIQDEEIKSMAPALKSLGLPFLDLYGPFSEDRDLIALDGIHPKAEGAKLIATLVARLIAE